MTLTDQFLRSLAADADRSLDCGFCFRSGLDRCDRTKHVATPESFAAYVAREDRIANFQRAAQETP